MIGDFYTPPQVAQAMGVRVTKVHAWIRSGELNAFNAAESRSTRPRYRITQAALEDFIAGRTVTPTAPVPRRQGKWDIPRYV